jgi:hypothetical protein
MAMNSDDLIGSVADPLFDREWHDDWAKIVEIFKTIEHLEQIFDSFGSSISVFRDITQKKMILDLKKYAFSLGKYIAEKYGDE